MNSKKIHIGKLIKNIVREKNIKDSDFAAKIGKSRQNVYDLYKRDNVDVKLLLAVGQALDYDFFQHFRTAKLEEIPETDVSIQLKVKSENLDELFRWISENGSVNISRK